MTEDLPEMDHLFDVTLSTFADPDTREFEIVVQVVDKYGDRGLIGEHVTYGPGALNAAVEWARGAVTAFMTGTEA